MNDSIDKNIEYENLEDLDLEQISGGGSHIIITVTCPKCGMDAKKAVGYFINCRHCGYLKVLETWE